MDKRFSNHIGYNEQGSGSGQGQFKPVASFTSPGAAAVVAKHLTEDTSARKLVFAGEDLRSQGQEPRIVLMQGETEVWTQDQPISALQQLIDDEART